MADERILAVVEQMYKEGALKVRDIEDDLGYYFDDAQHPVVKDMIARETANSFSMRHPWLTGIPTLGIAPALANATASEKIQRNLLRKHPDIRKAHKLKKELDHRREMERLKAELPYHAIDAAASTARQISRDKRGLEDREERPRVRVKVKQTGPWKG